MNASLIDFKPDSRSGVYLHPAYNQVQFAYSDGQEIEERILGILKRTSDLGMFSRELINNISDWPTEYHFSPVRHNLLRHIQFKETDRILELGCGCGAITRQLGESGASITAVEGSIHRAKAAAVRCRDLKNVRVYSANFQDIDFDQEFDYVTMIGVFEYCPVYFKGDDPIAQCLKVIKSALKKDGKFILAIENRLGLKYFSGIGEDHVGIPYFGIQDLYRRTTAITFGKSELITLLANNGFCSIEFQYPFPDYKIPRVVFTESAFTTSGFRPAEIIRQFESRDYANTTTPVFSENLVWPVLEANNLIPVFSNSFLVVSRLLETKPSETAILAVCYTLDRAMKYNVKTEFLKDSKDVIIVKKSPFIDTTVSDPVLIHRFDDEKYYSGGNLDADISKMIYENDFEGYVSKIWLWIDFVIKNGLKVVQEEDVYSSVVLPEYIDCVPINLLTTPDGLIYIDREWMYMKDFTVTTLLLRYLIYDKHAIFIDQHLKGRGPYYRKLLDRFGIKFNDEIYGKFMEVHLKILETVYPEDVKVASYNINTTGLSAAIINFLKKIKRRIQRHLK